MQVTRLGAVEDGSTKAADIELREKIKGHWDTGLFLYSYESFNTS